MVAEAEDTNQCIPHVEGHAHDDKFDHLRKRSSNREDQQVELRVELEVANEGEP